MNEMGLRARATEIGPFVHSENSRSPVFKDKMMFPWIYLILFMRTDGYTSFVRKFVVSHVDDAWRSESSVKWRFSIELCPLRRSDSVSHLLPTLANHCSSDTDSG